jgi:hypothetical protein
MRFMIQRDIAWSVTSVDQIAIRWAARTVGEACLTGRSQPSERPNRHPDAHDVGFRVDVARKDAISDDTRTASGGGSALRRAAEVNVLVVEPEPNISCQTVFTAATDIPAACARIVIENWGCVWRRGNADAAKTTCRSDLRFGVTARHIDQPRIE